MSVRISSLILLASFGGAAADECMEWVDRTPPPGARFYHEMAYDSARGVSVVFGGERDGDALDETWEWDGVTWVLRARAGDFGTPARRWFGMAYDSQRAVTVVFGGNTDGWPGTLGDTSEWDGTVWTLRSVIGPSARDSHAMAYDSQRGVTVLFGGRDASGYPAETWEWDGSTWTQRLVSGPAGRAGHGMAYDSDSDVIVLHGGFRFENSQSVALHDTWEWDGVQWLLRTESGPAAGDASMHYDTARQVVGMYSGDWVPEFWEWDGSTWTQQQEMGTGNRFNTATTYDAGRQRAVLTGGCCYFNDTWEWDGDEWLKRSPEFLAADGVDAVVYDSTRDRIVAMSFPVYYDGTKWVTVDKTWEWDGEVWEERSTGAGVPVSDGLVFDSQRGVVVSITSDEEATKVWEWDGTNWHFRADSGPGPRQRPSVVYDTWRGVTLLFGGLLECQEVGPWQYYCNMAGDLWAWDGEHWSLLTDISPGDRASASFVFDPMRGVAVLFGGSAEGPTGICPLPLHDTWEWDGASWAFRTDEGPSYRSDASTTFDSARGVSLLYGGTECDIPAGEGLWGWDGQQWSVQPTAFGQLDIVLAYHRRRQSVVGITSGFSGSSTQVWELVDQCGCDAPILRPYAERYMNCPGECYAPKNRYLSFVPPAVPGCDATGVALRVTLTDMPAAGQCPGVPDATSAEGLVLWVGPEVLGSSGNPLGIYALQTTPLFRNWTTVAGGVIHLSDCHILPCATYTVEAVADIHHPAGPYSQPLTLQTTARWGDVRAPGDSAANVIDIGTVVDCVKFGNPWPNNTWCDIYGRSSSGGADGRVNVLDVGGVVDAVKGFAFPYSPPDGSGVCIP